MKSCAIEWGLGLLVQRIGLLQPAETLGGMTGAQIRGGVGRPQFDELEQRLKGIRVAAPPN